MSEENPASTPTSPTYIHFPSPAPMEGSSDVQNVQISAEAVILGSGEKKEDGMPNPLPLQTQEWFQSDNGSVIITVRAEPSCSSSQQTGNATTTISCSPNAAEKEIVYTAVVPVDAPKSPTEEESESPNNGNAVVAAEKPATPEPKIVLARANYITPPTEYRLRRSNYGEGAVAASGAPDLVADPPPPYYNTNTLRRPPKSSADNKLLAAATGPLATQTIVNSEGYEQPITPSCPPTSFNRAAHYSKRGPTSPMSPGGPTATLSRARRARNQTTVIKLGAPPNSRKNTVAPAAVGFLPPPPSLPLPVPISPGGEDDSDADSEVGVGGWKLEAKAKGILACGIKKRFLIMLLAFLDVMMSFAFSLVATIETLRFIKEKPNSVNQGIPMYMAYYATIIIASVQIVMGFGIFAVSLKGVGANGGRKRTQRYIELWTIFTVMTLMIGIAAQVIVIHFLDNFNLAYFLGGWVIFKAYQITIMRLYCRGRDIVVATSPSAC